MTTGVASALSVFRGTVEVMLLDGILTREEKRLIVKLANQLDLSPEEPGIVYKAIREGTEIEGGRDISAAEAQRIFTRIYEVALINESLSKDEWRVIAHLRHEFDISDEEYEKIVGHLRRTVKEKYEENMVDKILGTLSDSVHLVGGLFDGVRKKSA